MTSSRRLIIQVTVLGRVYHAASREDRAQAEYPPHPGRLFSAAVNACERAQIGDGGRDALLWLERQPAPEVHAPKGDTLSRVTLNVPTNENPTLDRHRGAQPRTRPAAHLSGLDVCYVWPEVNEQDYQLHADALRAVLHSIGYLGTTSTHVAVTLIDELPHKYPVQLRPASPYERAHYTLRIPYPGMFEDLRKHHDWNVAAGTDPKRLRAIPLRKGGYTTCERTLHDCTVYRGYAPIEPVATEAHSIWEPEAIVLERLDGLAMPVYASHWVANTLFKALISRAAQPVPEVIHGHDPDGYQSRRDRIAIQALPFVGPLHGTGDIKGLAIWLLRGMTAEQRQAVYDALTHDRKQRHPPGPLSELRLRHSLWKVRIVTGRAPMRTLDPDNWTRPSKWWTTATPAILDPVPDSRSIIDVVTRMCEHVGLPEPSGVAVRKNPWLRGAVPATSHGHQWDGRPGHHSRRRCMHLWLEFDVPVHGPVLLGSGRLRGLGLCLPVDTNLAQEGVGGTPEQ